MCDKNKEWPISPTFLSLRQGCKEEDANYNNDGIFYTDYLRGFLADLSHDYRIQNALSIFQFVPEDFVPLDPNAKLKGEIPKDPKDGTVLLNTPLEGTIESILKNLKPKKKIIRIDSGTFINNGKLCDAFRQCGEKSFCFRQDSVVGIFASDELNSLDPSSDEDREKLKTYIEKYNQEHKRANIQVDYIEIEVIKKNRTYIHYTCPISLFEEHIFPIYVHGHVIACLMFGQMARDQFDRNKTFFDYRNQMKYENGDPIDFDTIEITSCKEQNEWEEKAHAIVERIIIFEKRIEERIDHRNIRYINDAFEVIEEHFLKEIKEINIKEEGVFHKFTDALNKAFSAIREKFDDSDDGFIRMFALPIDIEHDELIPIGWAGSSFNEIKSFKIALKQLKGIENTLEIAGKRERIEKQREIILKAANQEIKDLYDEKKDFFLPGWLAGNEVAYIVWKRHSGRLRDRKNKNNFKLYRNALKKFYSTALECYSYIRGSRMELLLETAIKVTAHESAHFILPAINAVENQLNPLPQEMILPIYAEEYSKSIKKYEEYKDEILELLDQLNIINSGSSLIFLSELKIQKEEIAVFYLLYKLKLLLRNRAMDSHKCIDYEQSVHYMKVFVDVTYMNHALYNLLDNAIKYGHEGSNIVIKMDVDKHKQELIIRITSYGIGIPKEEGKRIYNRFERGTEASKIKRGYGLGMYIVQKICKAHGGKVTHTSEKLSDYNIPILFNYKNKKNLAKKCSDDERSLFDEELDRLSGMIENEVTYDSRFVEYAYVFSTRINIPTYRNTFIVTIPLH